MKLLYVVFVKNNGNSKVVLKTKFCTARLHTEVQPITLLYSTLMEKAPLSYTFYDKKGIPVTYLLKNTASLF